MNCSPYLNLPADPRRIAEAHAETAAHYRNRAFEAAAVGFADAARALSALADMAQLRAEALYR